MKSLILLLLLFVPEDDDTVRVRELELNHVYIWYQEDRHDDPKMCVSLSQWIIWDEYEPRCENDTGWHVWCWRKHNEEDFTSRTSDGRFRLYHTGKGPPIVADFYSETWTIYDPEVLDARHFPKAYRKPLINRWRR